MYGYPPNQYPAPQAPMYRPEKSYMGESLLTLVLYWVGFFPGLIANILFLNNANRDERMGLLVRNKGCLQVLLWVNIIGGVLGCIVLGILMATGTLAAILSNAGY